MGMTVFHFESAVSAREIASVPEDRIIDHMRRRAGHALADKIARDAALYRRIDPTEDEKQRDPLAPTRHRWSVGVETSLSELEARERQMEEARRDGMRHAAEIVRQAVGGFARVEGMCKHVLMSTLEDVAREIESKCTDG